MAVKYTVDQRVDERLRHEVLVDFVAASWPLQLPAPLNHVKIVAVHRADHDFGIFRRNHCLRAIVLVPRSEEHTSELQSLMRISYAVFCLKKKTTTSQKSMSRHRHMSQSAARNITSIV